MLPHKTKRGAYALSKLDTFEGIPPKYTYKARVVVPRCLTALKLQPGRNFCKIGDLSKEVSHISSLIQLFILYRFVFNSRTAIAEAIIGLLLVFFYFVVMIFVTTI